jgi:hypothetical protein
VLKSIRNFRLVFANAIVLTTVLISSVTVQNAAYSQSFPSVPNIGNTNTANNNNNNNNKAIILNFDEGTEPIH